MLNLPLNFLMRPADPAVVHPWLLVLMHGVGSNEQDLFGLVDQIPGEFCVISLRAPYCMAPGFFSWFDFSIEPDGTRSMDAVQEAASRALLVQTVARASEQLGIPPARVVVGGFSQGGIMALSLLLTQPALMQAALVWHGRMLPQLPAQAAPHDALRGRQLWLSHGTHDNVIPVAHAQAIAHYVQTLPVALTYREFPGAHELRPAELAATVVWLQGLSSPGKQPLL